MSKSEWPGKEYSMNDGTLTPQAQEIYNRLTLITHSCADAGAACNCCVIGEEKCPWLQEDAPWDDFGTPRKWSKWTRRYIARRLANDE